MTGPRPSLALDHESPSQRRNPAQRLVASEQLRAVSQLVKVFKLINEPEKSEEYNVRIEKLKAKQMIE